MKPPRTTGPGTQAARPADATAHVEPLSSSDPVLARLSDRAGGPAGKRLRARRRGFWSIPTALTAATMAAVLLAALASQYCRINGWGGVSVYHWGCYSDVAALWSTRDLSASPWAPFSEAYADFEYPALTMLLASLIAAATHGADAAMGGTVLAYWGERSGLLFWDLTSLAAAGAWVVLVLATMKAAGPRPWDAAVVALSPAIIFGIGINWDIWPAAALALAVLCYLRRRWWLAGLLIGVGVSFKLYPLLMLGAVFTLAARSWMRKHEPGISWQTFARVAGGAAASWLVINVPIMLLSFDSWARFFVFSSERGAGYSSPWHVWSVLSEPGPSAETVSLWSFLLFAVACAGVLIIGITAPQPPRMVQLLFLVVAAFVLCNKVYSPQFMIWLVPLMVLAAPRLRDILVWHGFQILHFWAVWMYLAAIVGDYEQQHSFDPVLYVAAVFGHMLATGYIAVQVILDIYRPERDVVRAAEGAAEHPASSGRGTHACTEPS